MRQQDRAVWGFSPTQCNINRKKTQKAPTPQPVYYSASDFFFFCAIVTHNIFFFNFSVGSTGSRKYNSNLYFSEIPVCSMELLLYQLPRCKTGSRDMGWKCRKVEKKINWSQKAAEKIVVAPVFP